MHDHTVAPTTAITKIDWLWNKGYDGFRVLAIDGLAASGKSYLVAALHRRHPDWQILHLDELQRPNRNGEWRDWSDAECATNFVGTDELDRILHTLHDGCPSEYQRFDWTERSVDDRPVRLVPTGTVLVEGLYALRKALSGHYRHTAWVTVPEPVRQHRIAARPLAEPGWLPAWLRGERAYLAAESPHVTADVLIAGDQNPSWLT